MEILQSGDILHCTRKTLLSWIIKKLTRSQFSHTALFLRIEGIDFIIDAQKDGVNLRSFEQWMEKYKYKFLISRPLKHKEAEIKSRAFSKIGVTAYDFQGLLIKSPLKLITGRWRKTKKEYDKMFCSEFVAWCFQREYAYHMSPQDLYEMCVCWAGQFKTVVYE